MRTTIWSLIVGAMLLLAACGGDGAASDAGDRADTDAREVVDKTGSAPDKGSGAARGGTGKRLSGSVCSLLTVAEVEAAVKSGQTLTTGESGGASEDRVCSYLMNLGGGVAVPVLTISLLGERDPVSGVADYRLAYPRAVAISVRGAEAVQLDPSGPGFVVYKNGLLAYVQPVAIAGSETTLAIATKLAEPVAGRLP